MEEVKSVERETTERSVPAPKKRKGKKMSQLNKGGWFYVVIFTMLVLYTASVALILLFATLNSFKPNTEFAILKNVFGLPEKFTFDNYKTVFDMLYVDKITSAGKVRYGMFNMMWNSVLYAAVGSFLQTFTCCMMAYLCAKYKFAFSNFIKNLVIVVMIIPIVGNMASKITLFEEIGIMGSIWALWLPSISFTSINFLLFNSTFATLADDYLEAAEVDGASQARIMFQIAFPLVRTIFSVLFIITFVNLWNEYQTPMIYWEKPTIANGMFGFLFNPKVAYKTVRMAACMTMIVPILTVFAIFSKQMMGELTVGGLKG